MELSKKHFEIMKDIEGGATIWGYVEAKLIREIQRYNETLVHIVDIPELEEITGEEFDGAKQMPYFGAILTEKGKQLLKLN